MCAEASTVLRAVAADFFFNCWYLEIPSDNRIRHIPRFFFKSHFYLQSVLVHSANCVRPLSCARLSIGNVLEFLCWKWKPYPRVVFRKSGNNRTAVAK
jgi:hypothetical protein